MGVVPGTLSASPNALGIYVSGSDNTIGGSAAAADAIADNHGPGVTVNSGIGDLISANTIANNTQGIVLQNGGNQTLAFNAAASPPAPTLTSASTTGTEISISGQVIGLAADTAITIEFFASQAGDLTTVADQASVYLGSTTVTTDGTGAATFSVSDLPVSVPKGQVITATASAVGLGTSPMAASIGAVTPFVVTTTLDNGDNANPTIGSLRQAILAAIQTPGTPIEFDLPTTDPGYNPTTGTWTITLDPPLPTITSTVVIDGTTQPGYYSQAAINPSDPAPVILINGDGISGDGLTLAPGSGGSVIKGLAIFGFTGGAAIDVQSNGNTIAADWLGRYAASGTVLGTSNAIGLEIDSASNNTIGLGAVLTIAPPADSSLSAITVSGRDLISGNSSDGILVDSPDVGLPSSGNLIQDTFVGTDGTGTTTSITLPGSTSPISMSNVGYGIEIDSSMGNTVGGTTTDTLVLVSGNSKGGILISGDPSVGDPPVPTASANLVQNTYVGTNVSGTQALPNQGNGIAIEDSTANTIGGTISASLDRYHGRAGQRDLGQLRHGGDDRG